MYALNLDQLPIPILVPISAQFRILKLKFISKFLWEIETNGAAVAGHFTS
jgi:hypothetical protein